MYEISEKLSINIKSVGLNVVHNFIVPDDMNSGRMISLIVKTIQEEYSGVFFDKESDHFLIHEESGKVVSSEYSLKQLGIVNGEKFILV